MGIQYSMCWEDPDILLDALNLSGKDKVLSILSGGENVFAILLKTPEKIVAIDMNKEQIYLARLKVEGIKNLNFKEFVQFLGFEKSRDRIAIFNKLKKNLSNEELSYWNNNIKKIKNGVINCGKLERYLASFRKYILPLTISGQNLRKFLQLKNVEKQEEFFRKKWDNWRLRLLFRLFFSEKAMQHGRNKDYFKYSEKKEMASYYYERTKHGLTRIPIRSNFFMHYILTGTIPPYFKGHPYLDLSNFNKIKHSTGKIKFVHGDIINYLKKSKKGSFTKFNLSDIFELSTQQEYEEVLKEIVRVSGRNGTACYWNNLAPRHNNKIPSLTRNKSLSLRLSEKDRSHFYSRFIVERIN